MLPELALPKICIMMLFRMTNGTVSNLHHSSQGGGGGCPQVEQSDEEGQSEKGDQEQEAWEHRPCSLAFLDIGTWTCLQILEEKPQCIALHFPARIIRILSVCAREREREAERKAKTERERCSKGKKISLSIYGDDGVSGDVNPIEAQDTIFLIEFHLLLGLDALPEQRQGIHNSGDAHTLCFSLQTTAHVSGKFTQQHFSLH